MLVRWDAGLLVCRYATAWIVRVHKQHDHATIQLNSFRLPGSHKLALRFCFEALKSFLVRIKRFFS